VINLIEENKNRMILFQTVHLEFVSSQLLKRFLRNIENDEIDFELFEAMKKRLFTDYSIQEKLSKRWKSQPQHLSETETDELLNIFNSHFENEKSSVEQAKLLIEQIQQLKMKLFRIKFVSFNHHQLFYITMELFKI
jgi:uncharacterized membrane protein YqhA